MKSTIFNTVKHQTNIKGYWKNGEKIYIDNIELITCNNQKVLKEWKKRLFDSGNMTILYSEGNKAIIEDRKGQKMELGKRLEFKHKKGYANVQEIKKIINQYNGCTVYNKKGHIVIEVFTN